MFHIRLTVNVFHPENIIVLRTLGGNLDHEVQFAGYMQVELYFGNF
jgi:hypothetical protein